MRVAYFSESAPSNPTRRSLRANHSGIFRESRSDRNFNQALQRFAVFAAALIWFAFPLLAQPQPAHSQADTLYRQGLAAVKRGDLAQARAAFEQVVKLAPSNAEGHNSLGWVLFSQGQTAEAIPKFDRACD